MRIKVTQFPKLLALITLSSLFTFTSCDTEDPFAGRDIGFPEPVQTFQVNGVDPLLQPFLDNFVLEAQARGIDVDVSNVTLVFTEVGSGVESVCFFLTERIEINPFFIENSNLEQLVFHELGHCVLGMNDRFDSIMQDSDFGFVDVNDATLDEFFTETFFDQVDPDAFSSDDIAFFSGIDFL